MLPRSESLQENRKRISFIQRKPNSPYFFTNFQKKAATALKLSTEMERNNVLFTANRLSGRNAKIFMQDTSHMQNGKP